MELVKSITGIIEWSQKKAKTLARKEQKGKKTMAVAKTDLRIIKGLIYN